MSSQTTSSALLPAMCAKGCSGTTLCIAWVLRCTGDGGEDGLRAALVRDLLLNTFGACRHGSVLRAEIMVFALLEELRRRHKIVRSLDARAGHDGRLE